MPIVDRVFVGLDQPLHERLYRHTQGRRGGMSKFAREAIIEKLDREDFATHERIDPLSELAENVHSDKIIVVKA